MNIKQTIALFTKEPCTGNARPSTVGSNALITIVIIIVIVKGGIKASKGSKGK